MYKVKEIYYTLQGEGYHTGRPAVFVRLSGCNLWSGLEKDRENAICKFCDTDFHGMNGENGGKYNAEDLCNTILNIWKEYNDDDSPFIVCTGGEPGLQINSHLIEVLHDKNIEIAIETNGTVDLASKIDWICVSPKANTDLLIRSGDEIKIVYPQSGIEPGDFKDLDFAHFYLQPMDSLAIENNTQQSIRYCQQHPQWKLSVQTHKILGIK